ncbi:glycosyltransferase [Furfurilactobacillus entadae]|uniref:glycosyltransferase n=1 Tax=Furfurilactobacillus entadae TaxID=2922307 RepID=UPI0035E72D6E
MNILVLTPYMNGFGGTEQVIANFCDAFKLVATADMHLKVVDLGGTENGDWAAGRPIEIVTMAQNKRVRTIQYALTLYSRISKLIKADDYDFVISTNPLMWSMAKTVTTHRHLKAQVVAWYHYSLSRKPVRPALLSRADWYFAISSGIQQELIDAGIQPDRVKLIYNPIKAQPTVIARTSEAPRRFVYMGRTLLDGQKNLRELLLAFADVSGEWQLDVYGDGADRERAPEFATELGINDHIYWHGFTEAPWAQIKQADTLLLTSRYEGFPMVLVEALSQGVYVISSDCPTGPRDIINGENGRLYQLGDVATLTSLLTGVISGTLELPDQHALQQSVSQFYLPAYMTHVLNALSSMK